MRLIRADHDRRLEIPGVPGPVRRPVDIDKAKTGFTNLRTLRIYRFDTGSVIDGHAEEDEVFVIVMAGSIDLTLSDTDSIENSRPFTLAAPWNANRSPCVAYMPPGAAYRLVSRTDADVAYARATPAEGPTSRVFNSTVVAAVEGIAVLVDEPAYARRLRLRLVAIDAALDGISFTPIQTSETDYEALVHLRTEPAHGAARVTIAGGKPARLQSWDTVCVAPGDQPTLQIAKGSSALALIVLAI